MEINYQVSKKSQAVVIAAIVTVLFIAVVTVAADLIPALKAWLASAFTHHWIGKGVLASAIFVLVFFLLAVGGRSGSDESLTAQIKVLNFFAILGSLVILVFFLWEAFLK